MRIVNRHADNHPTLPIADCYDYLQEDIKNLPKRPVMKELEHLTPMGSEYWEDPVRCATTVRDRLDNLWRLLKRAVIERKAALEQLKGGSVQIRKHQLLTFVLIAAILYLLASLSGCAAMRTSSSTDHNPCEIDGCWTEVQDPHGNTYYCRYENGTKRCVNPQ